MKNVKRLFVMELWGFFFFCVFMDCLRIFVMFVNRDMCQIVLVTIESTDYEFSAAIFTELFKF